MLIMSVSKFHRTTLCLIDMLLLLIKQLLFFFSVKIMLQISDHVKANYINTRYITQEGIWCNLYPKHFVNVLLIHYMKQSREKEIVDIAALMREGLVGNTYKSFHFGKIHCDNVLQTYALSDIFKPFTKSDGTSIAPQVIIIDGAPGMGKTTLSKEIAYRWAKSQLLNDTKLVFFVYLRDPNLQKVLNLENFIHYFYNFDAAATEFSKKCADILINRSNDDITIILDGYDEYFDASGNSFLTHIMNRRVFPQCKLIITSRPIATNKLHYLGDIRVEVMGFIDDNKRVYVKQELHNHPDKMEKLLFFLDNNTTINSICYIPMIMTILVCIFKETEELPSDLTELYEKFITLVIFRYVEKLTDFHTPKVLSLTGLPELLKKYILELSKFAFETLRSDKIVFTAEDIRNSCPSVPSMNSDLQGLGLLKSTHYFSMKKIDNCVSYNFLHLMFQEFLAAYYINSLDPCKQFKLLKSTLLTEKYTNTWIMFVGLNKHKMFHAFNYYIYGEASCSTLRHYLAPIICDLNPLQAFFKLINYCADNTMNNNQLLCCRTGEIESSFGRKIMPIGIDKLILLNISVTDWNKLYLSVHYSSKCSDQILETFVIDKNISEALYGKVASHLRLRSDYSVMIVNAFTLLGYRANAKQICDGFKLNESAAHLVLRDCNIDYETAKIISSGVKNTNIRLVAIERCALDSNGTKLILEALSSVNSLRAIFFYDMCVDDTIASALSSVIIKNAELNNVSLHKCDLQNKTTIIFQALQSISKLKTLDLSMSCISYSALDDFVAIVRANHSLQRLRLPDNNLQHHGTVVISAIAKITTLTLLDLTNNCIPEDAAFTFANAINSNCFLEVLKLSNNKLKTRGVVTIARSLSKLSTLRVLHIGNNKITYKAADAISSVILNNVQLEELYLNDNLLKSGVKQIANALKKISNLRRLNLNNNHIPECVAEDLAGAMLSNISLQVAAMMGNAFKTNGIITLSKSLSRISTLKLLNFHNNEITEKAADAIALVVSNNFGLEELYLGSNKLSKGAVKIVEGLRNISTLKVLDLNENDASVVVATKLASAIASNRSLNDLRLSGNRLTTSGMVTIAKELSKISTLKMLNIRHNLITEDAADAIRSLLESNNSIEKLYVGHNKLNMGVLKIVKALKCTSSLKVLDFNCNNASSKIADELAEVINSNRLQKLWLANSSLRLYGRKIVHSLSMSTELTGLNLSGNYMPEEIADDLAEYINNNNCLQDLRLSGNRLTTTGIITIAKSLRKLSTLKVLNISSNLITEEAADAIVSVILSNNELEELYFGDNELQAGTCKIVAALKNTTLKILDIDNINLSGGKVANGRCVQPCGKTISQTLSILNTITSLYLGDCYVTERMAKDLAAVIDSNSLKCLQLKNNQLQSRGVMTICQSLQQLSTLTHFNIRNNRITEEVAECIASVILSNNRMQKLYLGDNILHNKTVVIIRALQSVSSLVVLYLSNMKMTEAVASDLVLAINNNLLLEKLYLAGNFLSNSLVTVLKACKKSNKYLTLLDLQCNCVDPSAMVDLASVTGDIDTLEALFLGGLSLSTEEQFKSNYLMNLKQVCSQFNVKSHQEHRIIEILNMEARRSSTIHNVKLNYDINYLPLTHTDYLCTDIFLNKENFSMSSLKSTFKLSKMDTATIIKSLPNISSLKVLDMEHSNIDGIAASELEDKLYSNTVLQQLWLRGNRLNNDGYVFILDSLEHISTLTILDLSFNNIGYQSADNVAAVIYINPALEQLWLDGNGLLDTGVMQICRALKHVTKLRILSLCSNGISDDSAEELSAAISSNDLLEDLLLGNNNLQTVGIYKIVHSLNNLVRLRKLDLFHNGVTKEAADELAVTISNCYTLQELYLSDNMLGTIGAVKILESLKQKSKLQVLTLSNNNITDEVIGELSFVLSRNPRLQVLLMGGNKLQTDGVITIAGVVKYENKIMHLLALCENEVSDQGREQVKMMFSDDPDIHVYV